jgi:hypothetical protein
MPVVFIGILFAWILIPMIFNPLRRPAPMIRNYVLRLTPIGTCIEEVIEVIENNESWQRPSVNRIGGFAHPRVYAPGWPVSELTGISIVGDKSIRTREIYVMWGLVERSVNVFWGFDADGKVIEVYVRSTFI